MILSKNFSFSELPFKIIWSALFLTFIGLITLYSISQHHQGPILLNPFKKQLLFLIPALLICFLIICIPRYSIHKYSYAFYFIGIIIVVLPFFNTSHAGTYRWLDFGLPFTIQPSEFAKVFTVLALARYLSDNTLRMKRFTSIINPIFFAFIPTFIVMNQPDLGTSIVMMAPVLPMLYWAGAKPFYLFLILAPVLSMLTAFNSLVFTLWAIILGGVIFFSRTRMVMSLFLFFGNIFLGLLSPLMWNSLSTYQQNRILTFINPEKDPLGAAYQIIQSNPN